MDDLIRTKYYDPSYGLSSINKFLAKFKKDYPTVKLKDVERVLNSLEAVQLHLAPHRPKVYKPIVSPAKNYILQCDLMDVSKDSHKNKGVQYLLCAIDVATRFAWVKPLKYKTSTLVRDAMAQIVEQMDPPAHVIQADAGSEFISGLFGDLMKEHNIKLEIADVADHNRQGIVERFNRTIRGLIERFKTANSDVYINKLPQLVENYNSSFNRGIQGNQQRHRDLIQNSNKRSSLRLSQKNSKLETLCDMC